MMKGLLILGMAILAVLMCIFMHKITPEDKIYPIWAFFVVFLFSLVIVFCC